jgi:DNA-directed RNA polymerase specialized sigma24 family protein
MCAVGWRRVCSGPARGSAARSGVLTAGSCPVPGYLPAIARPVLPWARRHVAAVARRYHTGLDDLWDETITALLRAALHYDGVRPFAGYAHTAIHRACWRYVCRRIASRGQPLMLTIAPSVVDDADEYAIHGTQGYSRERRGEHTNEIDLDLELAWPSAEDEVLAREAVRRALLLREHAELAAARGDDDTTSRLCAAASAADRVARRPRRQSPPSSRST